MSTTIESNSDQTVLSTIKDLDQKEKQLRLELATIRKQRDDIKAAVGYPVNPDRFEFINNLPTSFWWPTHAFTMLFSELNPIRESNFSPPDKQEWIKKGGNKEALFNLVIATVSLFFILKLINFIL